VKVYAGYAGGASFEITENTLLRLAADLLLSLGEEEVARLLEKGGAGAGDSF